MNKTLQKKIERAIRLLQSIRLENDEPIEIAYSGGKDSDVILELARMADIKYKAIYKCTTIDPPGTIKHALDNGCEIRRPKKPFFQLLREQGLPNRFMRFCCRELKEYPIYYNCVIGVRKAESTKRNERYKEPVVCRVYSSKSRVQQILPILDWTDEEELEFINERRIKLHPLYYDENGNVDIKRRLGCLCCPLKSPRKRMEDFKKYPNMLRQYIMLRYTLTRIQIQLLINGLRISTNGSLQRCCLLAIPIIWINSKIRSSLLKRAGIKRDWKKCLKWI